MKGTTKGIEKKLIAEFEEALLPIIQKFVNETGIRIAKIIVFDAEELSPKRIDIVTLMTMLKQNEEERNKKA